MEIKKFLKNKFGKVEFMSIGLNAAFAFLGIFILLMIVTALSPTFMGILGNFTSVLTDVPIVGTLFAKGGILPLIIFIAVFATAVYAAVKMIKER